MSKKKTNTPDLTEAFGEKVQRIAKLRGLSEGSADYMVRLLVQKTRVEPIPDTLFELYRDALEADKSVAAVRYKRLGDQALFVLGVFPESLDRRGVSKRYYADMGSSAYDRVSAYRPDSGIIYQELSDRFDSAAWTVRDVFEEFRLESAEQDVLALYEEWIRTGSLRVLRRLQELGFNVSPTGGLK